MVSLATRANYQQANKRNSLLSIDTGNFCLRRLYLLHHSLNAFVKFEIRS